MSHQTTIARPYAVAAFQQAREEGQLQRWSEMLAFAVALIKDPNLASLIGDPRLGRERLAALMLSVAGNRLTKTARNFVQTLALNGRLALLPAIAETFSKLRNEAEARVDVEIVSAYTVDAAHQRLFSEALGRRFGRAVNISVQLDRNLIGGAIVRVGDWVIDGSLQGGLMKMANELRR